MVRECKRLRDVCQRDASRIVPFAKVTVCTTAVPASPELAVFRARPAKAEEAYRERQTARIDIGFMIVLHGSMRPV
jgi:hypothetical protein